MKMRNQYGSPKNIILSQIKTPPFTATSMNTIKLVFCKPKSFPLQIQVVAGLNLNT